MRTIIYHIGRMQVIYLTFRLLVRENMSQSFYGKEVVKMV